MELRAELAAFDVLPDVVLAFDSSLTIKYVNPFARMLLEHEDTVLADQNLVEFLHPDDLERAAEVIGLIADDSLQTYATPAQYRARTRTGRWVTLEITATTLIASGPLAGLIVVVGRHNGDSLLRDEILEMLTQGRTTDEVAALVPRFGQWRHALDQYAVAYAGSDGEARAFGDDAVVELLTVMPGPDTPWGQARRDGDEVIRPWDDLGPELQAAAGARGLCGCMVLPVPDPGHAEPAVVVAWSSRRHQDVGAHRYALQQMARSLDIILQWGSHLDRLERAARVDALSGLANRSEFFRSCTEVLASGRHGAAVLFIDLDGFKAVNDAHGHAHGDVVIATTAERLRRSVRAGDVVARLGGDEFAVLCTDVSDADLESLADRIVATLAEPVDHGGTTAQVGASLGIARAEPGDVDARMVVARADAGLYEAKRAGKGRWSRA